MIVFDTIILKFDKQGEKTGWTYISIPNKIAEKLMPGMKKSFRVKGKLDDIKFSLLALLPMGDGNFILPLNADIRRSIKKRKGDTISVSIMADKSPIELSPLLLSCLEDEPESKAYFESMPFSHRNYYSRWIESAKTDETKARRTALALRSFEQKLNFSQMMKMDKI